MASASYFVLFVLSHFASSVILVGSCSYDFQCGDLGRIRSPFTSTEHPECGLCKVNCTDPIQQRIQLEEDGPWYIVAAITTEFSSENSVGGVIKIYDLVLKKQLGSHSCKAFNNLTLPNSNSPISLTFFHLKLIRCSSYPGLKQDMDAYFNRSYSSYENCTGYSIFYVHPNDGPSKPSGNLPPQCSSIQLPMVQDPVNRVSDDPFTLLTADFSLEYRVSLDCQECLSRGGQCSAGSRGEFQCSKLTIVAGNDKSRVLILILTTGDASIGCPIPRRAALRLCLQIQ